MNHKWDNPKNNTTATCLRCGIWRFAANRRYNERWWYYYYNERGVQIETLNRPECKKTNRSLTN